MRDFLDPRRMACVAPLETSDQVTTAVEFEESVEIAAAVCAIARARARHRAAHRRPRAPRAARPIDSVDAVLDLRPGRAVSPVSHALATTATLLGGLPEGVVFLVTGERSRSLRHLSLHSSADVVVVPGRAAASPRTPGRADDRRAVGGRVRTALADRRCVMVLARTTAIVAVAFCALTAASLTRAFLDRGPGLAAGAATIVAGVTTILGWRRTRVGVTVGALTVAVVTVAAVVLADGAFPGDVVRTVTNGAGDLLTTRSACGCDPDRRRSGGAVGSGGGLADRRRRGAAGTIGPTILLPGVA